LTSTINSQQGTPPLSTLYTSFEYISKQRISPRSGQATLAEIKGAVEDFKKKALADIERDLLLATQARFVEEQKKRGAHV
jgi:hypothetical protein